MGVIPDMKDTDEPEPEPEPEPEVEPEVECEDQFIDGVRYCLRVRDPDGGCPKTKLAVYHESEGCFLVLNDGIHQKRRIYMDEVLGESISYISEYGRVEANHNNKGVRTCIMSDKARVESQEVTVGGKDLYLMNPMLASDGDQYIVYECPNCGIHSAYSWSGKCSLCSYDKAEVIETFVCEDLDWVRQSG